MAQTGYTPIQLYLSSTAAAVPLAANLAAGELAINTVDGKLYYKSNAGVVTLLASTSGASGDVVGPASSTDNALARFDLATGKLIQNSVGILSDAGILTGLTGITSSGSITLSSLTSGRVTYAGTAGLLQDSANLTFNGTSMGVGGTQISTVRQYIKGTGTTSSTWALYVDNSTPTNIFAVRDDGNVGIGNTNGSAKINVTATSLTLGVFQQTGATGYGLTIIPGADTVYDAFTINNAANTVNQIRMYGDGSATFAGNVGVGATSTGKFLAYQSSAIQNNQGAYGSSGTFQTGNGTLTLGGGSNPRGIGVVINANRDVGTTLTYGNDFETFGLLAVGNVGTGGGYRTTGVAGYAESDGGVYGLRADAKTTSVGGSSIAVGLYVGSVTGSSTNYGVYVADAAASNYFGGSVGVGATAVRGTAKLDIRSDTSIAIGSNATYFGTIGYSAGTGLMSLAAESGGGINFLSGATERMRISSAGYLTVPATPAFAAKSLSNAATNSYVTTLPAALLFSSVTTNNGSFYNSSTGRFTAPVAGLYYFSWSLLVDDDATSGAITSAALYVNGSTTGYICYNQNSGNKYTQTSQSCAVSLSASDYVVVQGLNGFIHTGSETAFTGYQIG